jgi:hypothetical protein
LSFERMTAGSSARGTTRGRLRDIIGPMMMSLQTHVALTYIGDPERQRPDSHLHTVSDREVAETSESVGRLRRRLAQMHLAPAAQA